MGMNISLLIYIRVVLVNTALCNRFNFSLTFNYVSMDMRNGVCWCVK